MAGDAAAHRVARCDGWTGIRRCAAASGRAGFATPIAVAFGTGVARP
ncbi:MAG TPA: hypothetical protein VH062_22265 [Polyangiaceae bacterium]|nr:hypothetical protein [Polyangiaceae bacterium]